MRTSLAGGIGEVKLKKRLETLEQMPGNVLKKIQMGVLPPKNRLSIVVTGVWGAADFSKSTCKRTLHEDGGVWEMVFLKNAQGDAALHYENEEELNRWIASFPIELPKRHLWPRQARMSEFAAMTNFRWRT
jgi:hypothetical protein